MPFAQCPGRSLLRAPFWSSLCCYGLRHFSLVSATLPHDTPMSSAIWAFDVFHLSLRTMSRPDGFGFCACRFGSTVGNGKGPRVRAICAGDSHAARRRVVAILLILGLAAAGFVSAQKRITDSSSVPVVSGSPAGATSQDTAAWRRPVINPLSEGAQTGSTGCLCRSTGFRPAKFGYRYAAADSLWQGRSEACRRYRSPGWYAPPGVDLSAFEERGWL